MFNRKPWHINTTILLWLICLVKQHPFHLRESNQLRILLGLLTGHCHLKWHLFQPGMVDNQRCGRGKQVIKMALHVPCDCKAWPTGPAFYETRWLCGHQCQQDGAIHPGCRAAECVSKRAAQTISKGWSAWVITLSTLLYSVLFYSIVVKWVTLICGVQMFEIWCEQINVPHGPTTSTNEPILNTFGLKISYKVGLNVFEHTEEP